MASINSHATQRDQSFSMENFMGTPHLFFIQNPAFIHHPLLVVLNGPEINLNLFYDTNMLI
jgi:hypothetical protein